MITIHWRMPGDRAQLDVTCETTTAVWDVLCKLRELFEHTKCGKCGSENIQMITRVAGEKKNRFYEWKCQQPDCCAALQMHQYDPDKGQVGLYLKWDDEWSIYKRPDAGEAAQPPI